MPKRYRKLRGDTAYYPFAARTGLRARQRRHVRVLRGAGLAALALAAVLLARQTVFRGGQPDAPAAVPTAPAVTALPAPTHVTVQPLAATRDALADTQRADASAHTTPETAAVPAATAGEILPRYRALYEKNPDLIGWLRIDGTGIDLPVVQTPGDNEYYLRRGFDRFYAVGGTLFLDERCSVSADAPTANWLIYGHNMHDGSMFGQLVRYRDEDFYKAHPTFTFDTLYEGGTWQVVAAVDTALGADALPYYTFFDADTKLDWQHRVRAITEKALYDTGVMPEYGAQLLTLSTCGDTHPDTDAVADAIRRGDTAALAAGCRNVFSPIVVNDEMAALMQAMRSRGALAAEMTGSGSAVFGLFDDEAAARRCQAALRRRARRCFFARPAVCGVSVEKEG